MEGVPDFFVGRRMMLEVAGDSVERTVDAILEFAVVKARKTGGRSLVLGEP